MALPQGRVLEILDKRHGLSELLDFLPHGLPDLPLLHIPAKLADLKAEQYLDGERRTDFVHEQETGGMHYRARFVFKPASTTLREGADADLTLAAGALLSA